MLIMNGLKNLWQYYKDNTEKGYFRTPGEDTYLSGPFSNEKLLMYQAQQQEHHIYRLMVHLF